MCTGTSFALYAMAASAAVSAVSAIQQGQQQKEWGDYQAKQAEADAKAEKSAAEVHAEKIRKLARIQASEANASLAGSGVDVGEGTAININKDIYANAEYDALTTILNGADAARRGEAAAAGYRLRGQQARQAGNLGAASSVLGGAMKIAEGWKTPSKTGIGRG